MKVIKKITAIMLSIMMVLGMCSVVGATDGTGTEEKGTITIDNAIKNQTYTIYKMLDLESYDKNNKLYSYKPATGGMHSLTQVVQVLTM